jgi:hypothetical protein
LPGAGKDASGEKKAKDPTNFFGFSQETFPLTISTVRTGIAIAAAAFGNLWILRVAQSVSAVFATQPAN